MWAVGFPLIPGRRALRLVWSFLVPLAVHLSFFRLALPLPVDSSLFAMEPALLDESLETQYTSACTSLEGAVLNAKEGGSFGWAAGDSIASLSSAWRLVLGLHPRVAPPSALSSFPLLLQTLLVYARFRDVAPSTFRSVDRDAVATDDDALRVCLEALCALSESFPPAADHVGYRSQFRDFSRLLALGRQVDGICPRLAEEMTRSHPRAAILLGCIIDLQRLLAAGGVPFWLLDICGIADRLVRLTHLCRRFDALEDRFLWRDLRVRAVDCLGEARVAQVDGYERRLLEACCHNRSLRELAVSLPLVDRDLIHSEEYDSGTRRYGVDESDFEMGSPPLPFYVLESYDQPPYRGEDLELLTTRIAAEFSFLTRFLGTHHPEVYNSYRRRLIQARDDDSYPFRPVNVFGPHSHAEDWNFADYHCDDDTLDFPDAEDWAEHDFVVRVMGYDVRRRRGGVGAAGPMPVRDVPSLFDQP